MTFMNVFFRLLRVFAPCRQQKSGDSHGDGDRRWRRHHPCRTAEPLRYLRVELPEPVVSSNLSAESFVLSAFFVYFCRHESCVTMSAKARHSSFQLNYIRSPSSQRNKFVAFIEFFPEC